MRYETLKNLVNWKKEEGAAFVQMYIEELFIITSTCQWL